MRYTSIMTGLLCAAALCWAVLVGAHGQSAKTRTSSSKPGSAVDESAAVTQRTRDLIKAWGTMAPEAAAPFYAKDGDLVFFDIAPLAYHGWREYSEGTKSLFAESETFVVKPNDDLKVNVRGNLAWTTQTFHLSTKPRGGSPEEYDGRWTIIWEKRGKDWLIVHEHVSAPLQPK